LIRVREPSAAAPSAGSAAQSQAMGAPSREANTAAAMAKKTRGALAPPWV